MTLSKQDKRQIRSIVKETVEEQLAARLPGRGEDDSDDADEWAYEALSGNDIAKIAGEEQLSPSDLAERKTGVNPADCDSREEFAERVRAESE